MSKLKKVRIGADEWYPVYSFSSSGSVYEMPIEDYEFIKQAEKDFDKAQKLLIKAVSTGC